MRCGSCPRVPFPRPYSGLRTAPGRLAQFTGLARIDMTVVAIDPAPCVRAVSLGIARSPAAYFSACTDQFGSELPEQYDNAAMVNEAKEILGVSVPSTDPIEIDYLRNIRKIWDGWRVRVCGRAGAARRSGVCAGRKPSTERAVRRPRRLSARPARTHTRMRQDPFHIFRMCPKPDVRRRSTGAGAPRSARGALRTRPKAPTQIRP